MHKLLIFALLFIGPLASAETITSCEHMDFIEADSRTQASCAAMLKKEYSNQMNDLVADIKNDIKDIKLKAIFTESQRSFVMYKTHQCSYFFESNNPTVNANAEIFQQSCEATLMKQRVDYLRSAFRWTNIQYKLP